MARKTHSIGEPLFPYETQPEQPEEAARREEYRRRLAEHLKDPQFRQIEGFPIGADEDILALSDPPYYTACPNPFLPEILAQWQVERQETRQKLGLPEEDVHYRREPFAADVSEGKNDPIYNAHSYHTKVPHKAIMRYILHYTDPDDIVFDGFCGTGMTGVAAQLCGDKKSVEELGYRVDVKGVIWEGNKAISRLGARKAVLNDLSTAATFISSNYNTPVSITTFEHEANRILNEVEKENGWMYETWHPHCNDSNRVKGKINYVVWSDVFVCPQCGKQMIYWDVSVDQQNDQVNETWNCPSCQTLLSKNPTRDNEAVKVERSLITTYDHILKQTIRQTIQAPVLINYSVGNKRFEKFSDPFDKELINTISSLRDFYQVPVQPMMFKGSQWGDTWRAGVHSGITHVHHFFSTRNLKCLAEFNKKRRTSPVCHPLLFELTSIIDRVSSRNRYMPQHRHNRSRAVVGPLSGTLYIPSFFLEVNPIIYLREKLGTTKSAFFIKEKTRVCVSTQSSTNLGIDNDLVDYIFVDPPFGGNLMYSELNFIYESWLSVYTQNSPEAIVSNLQKKGLIEYQRLMEKCFQEYYRVLRSGRWMTIEFHNSQNSVWNALQEGILFAGFVVADVRTLDKVKGTTKQLTYTTTAKQDLIISAYKPAAEFEQKFRAEGGTESGAWAFIQQHMEQLPLPDMKLQIIEPQTERMPYLLFDRLIAFHLVRGLTVPLSTGEFYTGLGQRFLARDGMYFTASQAAEYDRLRLKAEKVEQLALFVTDEQSGIQWMHQVLDSARGGQPKSYSDLQPEFLKQLHQEKHEKMPELMVMLEQNFLQDEEGRWYAPDPDKQADLDALRARALLREFGEYQGSKGRLKVFRSEAVRAGFSKAWKDRDYKTIVLVGERLPEAVLQEDPKLKMYYDNALSRYERGPRQEALL